MHPSLSFSAVPSHTFCSVPPLIQFESPGQLTHAPGGLDVDATTED